MIYKTSELIAQNISLSDNEKRIIDEYIPIKKFKKNHLLLTEGKYSKESYFIVSGCVREFYNKDGEEITTNFYVEGDSFSSFYSFMNNTPANNNLQCVEECFLSIMYKETEEKLYKIIPKIESLCRISIEAEIAKQQYILGKYFTSTPEERYLELINNKKDLLQRVPQYLIASYIGVKPESLSRIRKRISSI